MTQESESKFDFKKYIIEKQPESKTLTIEGTGETFEVQ